MANLSKKIKQLTTLPSDGILLTDIQSEYSDYNGKISATGEDVQGLGYNINLNVINKINKINGGKNLKPLGYLIYNYNDSYFQMTKKLVYSISDITIKHFGIKYHIFKKIFKYYGVKFP